MVVFQGVNLVPLNTLPGLSLACLYLRKVEAKQQPFIFMFENGVGAFVAHVHCCLFAGLSHCCGAASRNCQHSTLGSSFSFSSPWVRYGFHYLMKGISVFSRMLSVRLEVARADTASGLSLWVLVCFLLHFIFNFLLSAFSVDFKLPQWA